MERLDTTSAKVVRDILEGQPTSEAKIGFAWRMAAGPTLGKAATLRWYDDGTLIVRPRTEAWRSELLRAKSLIMGRLTDLIGPDIVKRLSITRPD